MRVVLVCGVLLFAALAFGQSVDRYTRESDRVQNQLTSAPVCTVEADALLSTLNTLRERYQQGDQRSSSARAASRSLSTKRRDFALCVSQSRRANTGYEFATSAVISVAGSPNGLASLDKQGTVFIWNMATGQARHIAHTFGQPRHIAIAHDSSQVLFSLANRTWVIDPLANNQRQQLPIGAAAFAGSTIVGVPPGGNGVQVYGFTPADNSWHPQKTWTTQRVYNLSVSHDGQWAWTGVELLNLATGATQTLEPAPRQNQSVAFSTDGSQLFVAAADGVLSIYSTASGQIVDRWQIDHESYAQPALNTSSNGQWLAVRYPNEAYVLAVRNGEMVAATQTEKHSRDATFIGDVLVLSGDAGAAKLLSARTGEVLGKLVSFNSGNWAVLGESGYYDAAHAGHITELRWHAHSRNIQLSQLKDRYWHPGLLAEMIQHTHPTDQAPSSTNPPLVTLEVPVSGHVKLGLNDGGSGIGRVRVLVNDKEIEQTAAEGTHTLAIPSDRIIRGETNSVEVIAWDANDRIASRGTRVHWHDEGKAGRKPRLHGLVVGISDYRGEQLDLQFAASDAQRFAAALKLGADRLFGAADVTINVLVDAQVTKTAVQTHLNELRAADSGDILVLYFAGHGVNRDNEYFYLMHNATDIREFTAQEALSSRELIAWINRLTITKQVMVLDTCAAGAAQSDLLTSRGVPSDQIRAIERLKDRTGFHVLMGSAADRYSYETHEYGQGLLTYALLEGMRGSALRDNQFVDVSKLFQHTLDRVPQLARHLGGVQRPILAAPRADSFDIGLLTPNDQAYIPLAKPQIVLAKPTLIEASTGYDRLGLAEGVFRVLDHHRERLEEPSYIIAKSDGPASIKVSGSYVVEPGNIRVNLSLTERGRPIKTEELIIEYNNQNMPAVFRKIAAPILSHVERKD